MAYLQAMRIVFVIIFGLALSPYVKAASPELDQLFNELGAAFDDSRLEDVERIYEKMLPLSRQELGDDHPKTLRLMNNMADFLATQVGSETEAERLYQEELVLRRKRFGDADPKTTGVILDLKRLYDSLNYYNKATLLYEGHLPIIRSARGETYPRALIMMAELGNLYEARGRQQDAKEIYEEVLPLMQLTMGKAHSKRVETMVDLAELTWEARMNLFGDPICDLARLARAERFGYCVLAGDATSIFDQAIQLSLSKLKGASARNLVSLSDQASHSWKNGQYDEAIRLHEEALEICREKLEFNHPHKNLTLQNLLFLYEVTDQRHKVSAERERELDYIERELDYLKAEVRRLRRAREVEG